MSSLEYRFPPLTPEERERGRQRVLRSYRPNVARYFRNAESLRQDVVEEMEQTGATTESLAEKSGESPETVRFLADHDYAPVGATMRILTALGIKPANLPRECVTCRLEDR